MISHENYGPCFKAAAWRWECDKVQNWRFSESTMARLGWILAAFQNGQWLDASSHVKICWTTSSWSNQLAQFHVDVYIAKLHVSCLSAFSSAHHHKSKKTCQIQALKMSGPSCKERTRCKWPQKTSGSCVWLRLHWHSDKAAWYSWNSIRIMTCLHKFMVPNSMVTSSLVFATYWPRWKTNKKRFYQASRYQSVVTVHSFVWREWQIFLVKTGLNVKNLMVVETPHPYPAKTHSWTKVSWANLERLFFPWKTGETVVVHPVKREVTSAWMAYLVIWGEQLGGRFFFKIISPYLTLFFRKFPLRAEPAMCFACVLKTELRVFSYCSESLLHVTLLCEANSPMPMPFTCQPSAISIP